MVDWANSRYGASNYRGSRVRRAPPRKRKRKAPVRRKRKKAWVPYKKWKAQQRRKRRY